MSILKIEWKKFLESKEMLKKDEAKGEEKSDMDIYNMQLMNKGKYEEPIELKLKPWKKFSLLVE